MDLISAYREVGTYRGAAAISATTPNTAMRRLAPELLLTAKTQRRAPEELLRTLVEAEISVRDASNVRTRLKAAAFPGDQDPGRIRPGRALSCGPAVIGACRGLFGTLSSIR